MRAGGALGKVLGVALLTMAVAAAGSVGRAEEDAPASPADVAVERANRLFEAGAFAAAREAYAVAGAAFDEEGNDHGVVACAWRVAESYVAEGKFVRSIPEWELAIAEAEARFGDALSDVRGSLVMGLAGAYEGGGLDEEALGAWQEALAVWNAVVPIRAGAAARDAAAAGGKASTSIGHVLERLGRAEEAVEYFALAVQVAQSVVESPHPMRLTALVNFAGCLEGLGRLEEAVGFWQYAAGEARGLLRVMPGRAAEAVARLAHCHVLLGQHETAVPLFEEAVAWRRRMGPAGRVELGWTLCALASAHHHLHHYEAATGHWREATRLGSEPGSEAERLVATAHMGLGRSRIALGDTAGFDDLERAITLFRAMGRPAAEDLVAALVELGGTSTEHGRAERGLEALEEGLSLARTLPLSGVGVLVEALNALGHAYWTSGRAPEALAPFEEGLRLCEAHLPSASFAAARAHLNVGAALRHMGRHEAALALVDRAIATWRGAVETDEAVLAQFLGNRGLCLASLERYPEALEALDEAVAIHEEVHPTGHRDHALALHNRVGLLLALGRAPEALPDARDALAMTQRLFGPDHPDVATYRSSIGSCLNMLEQGDEAIAAYEDALAAMRRQRHPRLHLTASELGEALIRAGRPADAAVVLGLAIGHLESLRESGNSLDVSERGTWFGQLRAGKPYFLMTNAQLLLGDVERALGYLEQGRARSLLDLLGGSVADRQAPTPVVPAAMRRMLGPRERMLVYTFSPIDGAVFVVGPPDVPVRAIALTHPGDGRRVTPEEVGAAVDALLAAMGLEVPARGRLREGTGSRDAAYGPPAERLFGMLVHPGLWEELRGLERVFLVPDGALHRLPFEALVPPGGDPDLPRRHWLDDGPAIAYVPSASVLAWCRTKRAAQRAGGRGSSVVAVGDPLFGADTGLARLRGTRREVAAVAEAYAETGIPVVSLVGEKASEARVFEQAADARLLLLATHGLGDERPGGSRSSLFLTPAAPPVPEDDGRITLRELLERWEGRLAGCELVVLSACETQVGPIQRDEGVFALPWGFHHAGCPAVVASLWNVGDDATATLMGDFFGELAGAPAGEVDRLALFTAARRRLRERHPHPRNWAAFVYLGAPR